MDHASEYRKRAKDCIELTKKISSASVAEAWTALAEQADRQKSREGLIVEPNAPSGFKLQ